LFPCAFPVCRFNTSFWLLYGLAKLDPVIYAPNMIGLLLGIIQGVYSLIYPRRGNPEVDIQPLLQDDPDEFGEPEDAPANHIDPVTEFV
jgi:hypothetical protein